MADDFCWIEWRRHCRQLCGGMKIPCRVMFSCSRKATLKRLKALGYLAVDPVLALGFHMPFIILKLYRRLFLLPQTTPTILDSLRNLHSVSPQLVSFCNSLHLEGTPAHLWWLPLLLYTLPWQLPGLKDQSNNHSTQNLCTTFLQRFFPLIVIWMNLMQCHQRPLNQLHSAQGWQCHLWPRRNL